MKRKLLSVLLATTMLLPNVIPVSAESLSGTAWWDANNGIQKYELVGDGEVTFDVAIKDTDTNGYGAFTVRLDSFAEKETGTGFITTTSVPSSWYYASFGSAITLEETGTWRVSANDIIEVSITKTDNNFKIVYDNKTAGATVTHEAKNTSFLKDSSVNTRVVSQSGQYDINVNESTSVQSGDNTTLNNGSSIKYTITVKEAGEFWAEFDGDAYTKSANVLTGSDKNIWLDGDVKDGSVSGAAETPSSDIKKGEHYTVKVSRTGSNFSIKYLKNNEDGTVTTYCDLNAQDTALGSLVNISFVAQVGTYDVTRVSDTDIYTQYKKTGDTYTVRIVADVKDLDLNAYKEIGFKFNDKECALGETVYKTIVANGSTIKAEGHYVVVEVTDVPANAAFSAKLVGTPVGESSVVDISNVNEVSVDMNKIIK